MDDQREPQIFLKAYKVVKTANSQKDSSSDVYCTHCHIITQIMQMEKLEQMGCEA